MRVDLHVHSTASDGVYAPGEVVQIALTNQLDIIALTDHDNVSGVVPAQQAAAGRKLEVLAGVELSSEDDYTDRHILGYLLDVDNAPLQVTLTELRDARTNRAEHMVQKLAAIGVNIPLQRVMALAGTGSVGRPHVAQVLAEQGYVNSIQEAFERYIGNDGPAYVPHYRLEPARAIELIHGAGGVAVLAHPGHYDDYRSVIAALVPLGLDGVEVYYPDHVPALVEDLRVLARQYNLVMTVGSDFHRREGDGAARIGSVRTPPNLDIVGTLRERAGQYR
ncbi:MAG: PHP domain-containing protein [Anaerolineae bacterium]|nr:PHP domain-containing protein [Anaerolineae bacterium]